MTTDKMTERLDPREDLFCSNYTALGTETFNHKEKSALAARYAEASAKNQATKLLRRPEIQQRIDELKAENRKRNNVSTDSVVENLTHDRDMARAKGDWQAAIRADELIGKTLGCFVNRQEITDDGGLRLVFEMPRKEAEKAFAKSVESPLKALASLREGQGKVAE